MFIMVLAGCGAEKKSEGDEGDSVTVDGAVYSVQYTRLLNADDSEDRGYLAGQPETRGRDAYLGVFLKIKNDSDGAYKPPRDIEVIEAGGKRFSPIDVSSSAFALDFDRVIPPGETEPAVDTAAANGPGNGALVLYKITQSTVQRQPLTLEIPARSGSDGEIHIDI